ncbi:hypothetical protein PAPYR_8626 [Paratrimastix pyriformis]|uniref:C2 domain-containing protein n=1 Tax=Paratrimastix pyriformis TaxID=342808 RepID=A0ABQ8UAC3_9EUKA|nr:hypothetical protein PAPYR_8626 [Paratrimastix pyriformis]
MLRIRDLRCYSLRSAASDLLGPHNPYLVLSMNAGTVSEMDRTRPSSSQNPMFNEIFQYNFAPPYQVGGVLTISAMDSFQGLKDKVIGEANIRMELMVSDVERPESKTLRLDLLSRFRMKAGEISFTSEWTPGLHPVSAPEPSSSPPIGMAYPYEHRAFRLSGGTAADVERVCAEAQTWANRKGVAVISIDSGVASNGEAFCVVWYKSPVGPLPPEAALPLIQPALPLLHEHPTRIPRTASPFNRNVGFTGAFPGTPSTVPGFMPWSAVQPRTPGGRTPRSVTSRRDLRETPVETPRTDRLSGIGGFP